MASVKFLLRKKTSNKSVSIHYAINLSSDKRLRGATTIKITPKYWDHSNQKVRNMVDVSNIKDSINKKLTNFKLFILDKIANYQTYSNSEIIVLLKKDIAIYFGKTDEDVELTFYTYIDKFIEQSKKRVSSRTIRDYTRTVENLKDFEKKIKYELTFDTVNLDFYFKFKSYLENKNYSINTIGKFIKIIKVFMNSATEEGINTNTSFKNKRFSKTTAYSEQIFLTQRELQQIIALDLSDNSKMENARDLFIVGAYTGLRVSDFNGLTKESIITYKNTQIFKVLVKKTKKYIDIPIHNEVKKILIKNNGNLPNKMTAQHINDELKKIGKLAEINEIITINSIKGGVKITEKKKKYELISNHTARRSFCTNAYISGMPTLDIMAISGHTSERTFLNYIKISSEERAVKIANNPFFKVKSIENTPP